MIYLQLFWVYTVIGLFGFGGGYAMLSLIQEKVVHEYQWISAQEFTDIVAISQMTPGPIGINSATYIGYSVTGNAWGSIVATFAISLPSFILVLLISHFFDRFRNNRFVDAAFTGLRPASVGLIAAAALMLLLNPSFLYASIHGSMQDWSIDKFLVKDNFIDWWSIGIFCLAFFATIKRLIHPILLIVLSAIVGLLIYY